MTQLSLKIQFYPKLPLKKLRLKLRTIRLRKNLLVLIKKKSVVSKIMTMKITGEERLSAAVAEKRSRKKET